MHSPPLPQGLPWLAMAMALAGCTGSGATDPAVEVAGRPESAKTDVLEMGATVMQPDAPTDALDIYLVGFHPMKEDPQHQFETHHFCRQVNEDFAQCALYDGNTAEANLNGIEYIISERLFETLPEGERQYWHPHNGEILSGQLVAPGLPTLADKELMQSKINSYGKTWHTWDTGHGQEGGDTIPLGEPALAWSFNRFGEAAPGLVESRDERMGISTEERRRQRLDLIEMAHPQEGVDALKGRFEGPTEPIQGVVDTAEAPGQAQADAPSP
jgi:hypothetical protein